MARGLHWCEDWYLVRTNGIQCMTVYLNAQFMYKKRRKVKQLLYSSGVQVWVIG